MDDKRTDGLGKGSFAVALCLGFLLAWWNMGHENGYLLLTDDAARMSSCVASILGALLAWPLMRMLPRRAEIPKPLHAVIVGAVMLLCQIALDWSAANDDVAALSVFQGIASLLFFGAFIGILSLLPTCNPSRMIRRAVVVLAVYFACTGIAFLSQGILGSQLLRVGLHSLFLGCSIVCLLAAMHTGGSLSQPCEGCTVEAAPPITEPSPKRRIPWQIYVAILSYAMVFGFTHALASGVLAGPIEKSTSGYLGIGLAALTLLIIGRVMGGQPSLWPALRQFIFPLSLLSFVLLPFGNTEAAIVSMSVAECAQDVYLAFLLIMAALAASKIHVSPLDCLGFSICVAALGYIPGVLVGNCLKLFATLDGMLYNLLTVFALIALCVGTFWVGNDRQVSYVWGMEEKHEPRRFAELRIAEHCEVARARFQLTKRETEILRSLVSGKSAQDIADESFTAVSTVRTHIARIHKKTGTHSQREINALVLEEGERD